MKKQKSSLPKPAAVPAVDTRPFGQVFIITRNGTLLPEPGMPDGEEPLLNMLPYEEMSKLVFANRPVIFGERTIGLTAKIGTMTFPFDAFLFDFSNPADPKCFLLVTAKGVAVSMLAMIAIKSYLEAIENRAVLIEMLSKHIRKDKLMQRILKPIVEGSTIEKMLEYMIRKRLRALFLSNEDDPDCIKLFTSFAETHSDTLDIIFLRKYRVGKVNMLSMFPAFVDLKEKQEVKVKAPKEKIVHTEENHFEKSSETVRTIYKKLKAEAIKIDKSIVFNPKGKHYVSMKKGSGKNLAFFHFRKTSTYLVVMLEEKLVRKMVKKAEIKTLPPSVQSFWNGASTGLVISSTEHLKEVAEVLKKIIKQ